jgi:SpoVK/Ycf46/Vps4 family AAA+-type ATPase
VRDVGVGQLEVELDNDDTNKSGIRKMAEGTYEFGKDVDRRRVRLTSDLHLICRGRVRGFSLNKKEWMEFYLDLVKDVEFNEDAFSSLVLPAEQKEVILSFAESQASGIAFDDVICGKGRGHITLLSGPPGVGKTLTAESVAEHMRVPLYTLSAGDLGIHTLDVENRLNTILDMVARWNAVLLLDECDIYLERRTAQDLERNKLVSIFLRLLEYYEGILFLTTNRIDNIDSAFQSRIHISLSYPELDDGTRRLIWENFLDRLGVRENWSDDDLDELAKMELNGRQIKNVLKSAALLSARKKEGLSRSYVDLVLGIEKRRPGVAPEQELGREWVA